MIKLTTTARQSKGLKWRRRRFLPPLPWDERWVSISCLIWLMLLQQWMLPSAASSDEDLIMVKVHSVSGQSFQFDTGPGFDGGAAIIRVEAFDKCRTEAQERISLGELYPTNSVQGIQTDASGIHGVGTTNNRLSFVFAPGIEQNSAIYTPLANNNNGNYIVSGATVEFCCQVGLYLGDFLVNWKEIKLTYNIDLEADVSISSSAESSSLPPQQQSATTLSPSSSWNGNIFNNHTEEGDEEEAQLPLIDGTESIPPSSNASTTSPSFSLSGPPDLVNWDAGEDDINYVNKTQTVDIYNEWFISNAQQLTASMLMDGPEREILEQAYIGLVHDTVRNVSFSQPRQLAQTEEDGPKLVSFDPTTATILQLVDTACAQASLDYGKKKKKKCQTVHGRFQLLVFVERISNTTSYYYSEEAVLDTFTTATQVAILEGKLQEKILEVQQVTGGSSSSLVVEGAPETVTPPVVGLSADNSSTIPSTSSSNATTHVDGIDKEKFNSSDSSSDVGVILGVAFTVALILAVGVVVYWTYTMRKEMTESLDEIDGLLRTRPTKEDPMVSHWRQSTIV